MQNTDRHHRSGRLAAALLVAHLVLLLTACARMGSPDGGWYDDTPPRVVGSVPLDRSTNVRARKIAIYFNEFIKVQDAQNKVIISPPQLEQPEIKDGGKRILVELKDSLKDNTTYTIDFGDAIVDNNEGNPMGNYAYSFSTGAQIDTFQVSGYVLNAEDLEPIKGILVGLYDDLSDTVFRQKPMIRISRTDGSGHFTVKGVAPGKYRAYALMDADGDFVYNQKSEQLAFSHATFEPSWKPDTRQDTIWRDSLHIDNIVRVPYTHFLPDDITLMAFTAVQTDRYLLKNERKEPERLDFYFSYGNAELPVIRGLNFEADSAFVLEASERQDTLLYWLCDTALVNQDTLRMEVQYLMTDTAGVLFNKTDTLELLPKMSYEKRLKEQAKEHEKWQKEQDKKKKRGEPYDSVMAVKPLEVKVNAPSALAPDQRIWLESPTPIESVDTAGIHLYSMIDSTWYEAPFTFRQSAANIRRYEFDVDWREGVEYSLEIDSAAFRSIYGLESKHIKQGIKVRTSDDFCTLSVTVSGVSDTAKVVVQLLSAQGSPVKVSRAVNHVADFFYVTPGKYYMRAFIDFNGNGKWDTGDYDSNLQAEPVYYYTKETECKEKWDIDLKWNLTETPRFRQKPAEITKQKADKQAQLRNRNAQRAKELGIKMIEEKTGVKL